MAVYSEDQLKFWSKCLSLSKGITYVVLSFTERVYSDQISALITCKILNVVHSVTQVIDLSKAFCTFRMSCGFTVQL
jgi:hypothetical protein